MSIYKLPTRVSKSRLDTFLRCELMYFYRYNLNLEPVKFERPLVFGSMGHTMLEYLYKNLDPFSCEQGFRDEFESKILMADDLQKFETDIVALNGMITAYVEYYKTMDEKYTTIMVEEEVSSPKQGSEDFDSFGIPDWVYEDSEKRLWVCDHKFLSKADEALITKLPLDMQVQMNTRMVEKKLGRKVFGFMYNIIKKPTKRLKKNQTMAEYQREISTDYINDPDKFFTRVPIILTEKHFEFFDSNFANIQHRLKQAHECGQFVANTTACDTYGLCSFMPICLNGINKVQDLYRKREYRKKTNVAAN